MSLRARLLLAIGAVALIALVAADVATYSSLRSFLYDRVDQSLANTYSTIQQARRENHHFDGPPTATVPADTFAEVRQPDGSVLQQPAYYRGGRPSAPKLPVALPGLASGTSSDEVTYFTVNSVESGGPRFRVQ